MKISNKKWLKSILILSSISIFSGCVTHISNDQNITLEQNTTQEQNNSKEIDPLYKKLNVGFGGSSTFPFVDERNESNKIYLSAANLLLDDNLADNSYYANIKKYDTSAFVNLHGYLKRSKFVVLWMSQQWQESWFNLQSLQKLMNAGYIPVFNYWYFGDKLVERMPNNTELEEYKKNNEKVADFLAKLDGRVILIMEPEFNKKPVLNEQHKFATIIAEAIDTIKAKNPKLLMSLSMTDTGSRGANDTASKCGYEHCALGDEYAWSQPETVFDDLSSRLDFVSFHQMIGQFSRNPANPGDWDNPNPISYTDEQLGIDYTASRIANFTKYLHDKYSKPVMMPYIGVMSATWKDDNDNGKIEDSEIDKRGWEDKITNIYRQLSQQKEKLQENGLFGYAPMALFDNPRHDYGGYQYFMQNEYHLGLIGSSAIDEDDIATYGDLRFKGDGVMGYIYGDE